jgi:predicted transcriptional regulator
MLIDIRNLIKERKKVTVRDLSIHFKMDKSALEPIINRLQERGDIIKTQDLACVGCKDKCPFAGEPMVVLEWCG